MPRKLDDDPVPITRVQHEWEAALLIEALAEAGIRAMPMGGMTAGFRAEAPSFVEIVVARRDAEEATRVIDAALRERADAREGNDDDQPAA
jgi:hypothetical protein